MGIHYLNASLLDAELDPFKPEMLVYRQNRHRPATNWWRWSIVQSSRRSWDALHPQPPTLFGHPFHLVRTPNRYGTSMPLYELHLCARTSTTRTACSTTGIRTCTAIDQQSISARQGRRVRAPTRLNADGSSPCGTGPETPWPSARSTAAGSFFRCGFHFRKSPMKRYVIERDIPGVGALNAEQLRGAATTSNSALEQARRQGAVGAVLRHRRQDLLHLPGRPRVVGARARQDQRLPRFARDRGCAPSSTR